MTNRFIILWDTVENKSVHAWKVKPKDFMGSLLHVIKGVYESGLCHRIEIIHVGTKREPGGTITRDTIARFGMLMTQEVEG